jgi:putative DNA primase/helicase
VIALADILPQLEGVKRVGSGWAARCPLHDDQHQSLSLHERDGNPVFKCHAGCDQGALWERLTRDLPKGKTKPTERDVYLYRDEDGSALFEVVRFTDKAFRQRTPDGRWGLNGARRVLFGLPELAAKPGKGAVVCEGEKDALRLSALGILATCNPMGAGKWRDEYSETLRGRKVWIIPDNDEPGRQHANQVAKSLSGVATEVRLVELPGANRKGYDVSDWLDDGHTVEELRGLLVSAPLLASQLASGGRLGVVDLETVQPTEIDWLWLGRIPFGKLTIADGDPGLGKSTVLLDIACRASTGGQLPTGEPIGDPFVSLIITSEDAANDTIVPRIIRAGGDLRRIKLIRNVEIPDDVAVLEDAIRQYGTRFVVIDPLMAYFAESVKTQIDTSVRKALKPLAEMAERTGAAIVPLRHLSKEQRSAIYRGGGSIGISGVTRSVLAFGTDPEDEDVKVLASVKLNVGRRPSSLKYRIRGDSDYAPSYIEWTGESQHSAEDLIGLNREGAREKTKTERLAEAMVQVTADAGGEILAVRGYERLEALGFDLSSEEMKTRARRAAGKRLESFRSEFGGPVTWRLLGTPGIGEIGDIKTKAPRILIPRPPLADVIPNRGRPRRPAPRPPKDHHAEDLERAWQKIEASWSRNRR